MLNTLAMTLQKRGSEYVDQFLSEKLIITEKLDTYRILFENVNGEIKFFKKDNSELNLTERVLTNIWEDAIIELSIILSEADIPEGLSFGVAYTPVNKPIRLEYSHLPKYILTDVTKRHGSSKKVKETFEYEEVFEWAKTLNIGRPPVIFDSQLSGSQKSRLLNYATGKFNHQDIDKLEFIFEDGSYSKAPIIEGVILKGKDQVIQIESYEFKLLNESYKRKDNSRDFYDLTLININSFMDKYAYPKLSEGESNEKYLEIICDIFNQYCESGNISESVDPKYLTPPSYGYAGELNLLLLKNKKTIKILERGNKIHESVFKIMLSSFRKYKRPMGLLRESDVERLNTHIYFINEKTGIDVGEIPSLAVGMLTENKIEEAGSNNIVVQAVDRKIRTDVDNMRIISSIQKAFRPTSPKLTKGKQKCVIYVTDPQPFTISQQENVESLARMWKMPVILAFVKGAERRAGEKFHLSDEVKQAQIETFADNKQKLVPAFFSLESWDLVEIFQYARPKYEPMVVISDMDKKSEFSLQLYFEEEIMGGRLGVERDFNIGEMDNRDKLAAFRAIEDNKFVVFKDITPQSSWGYFDLMVSEYKEWNGSIPAQFGKNKLNK